MNFEEVSPPGRYWLETEAAIKDAASAGRVMAALTEYMGKFVLAYNPETDDEPGGIIVDPADLHNLKYLTDRVSEHTEQALKSFYALHNEYMRALRAAAPDTNTEGANEPTL